MQIQDATANYSSSNVTITTTTEQVAITTPLTRCYRNSGIAIVWAYASLTLGTGTTGVTQKIRRGTAITDTLVNEANVTQIQTAAGSNEHYAMVCFEQLNAEQVVQYSFTLLQAGASANGTILEAGIVCLIV